MDSLKKKKQTLLPLPNEPGLYAVNSLGRLSSSLKFASAEVDSQHSCKYGTNNDSQDSCHQTWHVHSWCVSFKEKTFNKIQAPLFLQE